MHSIYIKTTASQLYEAITTQKGISGWWAPQTKVEPKIGAPNEISFGPGYTLTFRVDKLEPARHVAWTGMEVPPDWKGTRLFFDLAPEENSVKFGLAVSL